ncbi:MAG: helix-turn-helix domain-containing protein [Planctomycetia bacterium]|nr:helix-turn-helix domain-containing protein [Planctomycetia bacterium]
MPRTQGKPKPQSKGPSAAANGSAIEVLTLAEAAAYLRLSEDAVRTAVREHGLPGREVHGDWRFLKAGIQEWLMRAPKATSNKDAWRALVGVWKHDPTVDALLEEIDQQRKQLASEVDR